jgi:hypothetical protein
VGRGSWATREAAGLGRDGEQVGRERAMAWAARGRKGRSTDGPRGARGVGHGKGKDGPAGGAEPLFPFLFSFIFPFSFAYIPTM